MPILTYGKLNHEVCLPLQSAFTEVWGFATRDSTIVPHHANSIFVVCVQAVRQPPSADGQAGRLPKPDVVIASFEALTADLSVLRAISWEVVVLDARHPRQVKREGMWSLTSGSFYVPMFV